MQRVGSDGIEVGFVARVEMDEVEVRPLGPREFNFDDFRGRDVKLRLGKPGAQTGDLIAPVIM